MKRIASIVLSAMLLMIFSTCTVFAAGFDLESSYPEDGTAKVQSQNVLIKLNFTEPMSAEQTQAANKNAFKLADAQGKDYKFDIIYNSEDPNNVNLLVDGDLEMNVEYTVTINPGLIDDAGDQLGAEKKVVFSTMSNKSTTGYFFLMGAMIILMVVMTIRDQKKAMAEEDDELGNYEMKVTANPYKLAKEKGISVEEANKIIAEEKAKIEKKQEKRTAKALEQAKEAQRRAAEAAAARQPKKKVYNVKTKRTTKMHK